MRKIPNQLPKADLCCGCEACSEICPSSAINMAESEGFTVPDINPEKCTGCNACERVCPIINREKIQLPGHNIKCFAGFLKKPQELKTTASGGAATALSRAMLRQKGIVYGVAYSEDYKNAEYMECRNETELKMLKGSKYIHAAKKELYTKIKKNLGHHEKVLVFGLPCEIGAVKSFLGKEYDNLTTCELICHGPTSPKVQKDFVERLEKRYHSTILEFNVRYNDDIWSNPYVYAKFQNGKIYKKPLYKTDFGYAFAHFIRPSCYHCQYKGNHRAADITIGDFWGNIETKEYYNKDGVSAIMAHTDKGLALIHSTDDIQLYEVGYDMIRPGNPRLEEPEEENKKTEKFRRNYKKHGLPLTCMLTRDLGDIKRLLF